MKNISPCKLKFSVSNNIYLSHLITYRPISDNPNEETLVIEVWDFDPAETIGEKMNKFFEVRGAKGFRKLMKEIAVTASAGKHDNEFVGCAKVPLKTIPAGNGLVMWYNLDKKGKTRTQGTIKVKLNFSSEKNDQVASQEHRNLLKILLYHELVSESYVLVGDSKYPFFILGKLESGSLLVVRQI